MSIERKPNKALRIGLAATVGFLGAAGAVTTGKAILDAVSRSKVAASEQQPSGLMPTQQAFNELVTVTPTSIPTVKPTEIPATATSVPPTVEATRVPTIVPTIEPTKAPTVVPTKEAVQEVPCGILPDKYCSQVKFINWTDQQGNTYKLAGFHLPAGVSIFAPIDGEFALPTGGTAPHAGSYGNVRNLNDPTPTGYIFAGDYQPDGFSDNVKTRPVKRGSLIGHTTNTGIDNFGYSLIVRINRMDPSSGKFYTPENILENMFSGIPLTSDQNVANVGALETVYTAHFEDAPAK